jgi:AraC-like DNA-binding protein
VRVADLPLSSHVLFESQDREEVRERVARVFCPHELQVCRADEHLDSRQNFAALGRVSVSYLRYGAAVGIHPVSPRSFYLVQVPISGHASIRIDGREIISSPRAASILNPSDELRMQFSADCGHLIVRFEATFVQSLLAHHFGAAGRQELRFGNLFDCGATRARQWLGVVRCAVDMLESDAEDRPGPLVRRQLEHTLLAMLLEAQPNNFSEQLAHGRSGCAPRHVRKAIEFIEAHLAEPIGIEEIVDASGVSARSLYEGFRRFRGTSPMEFLRSLRLRHVREDLLRAEAGATVSQVAASWGFYQFGRFAGLYRQLCGESPSDTLRRARAMRD